MADTPEFRRPVVQFLPDNSEPLFGEEALDALQDALDPAQNTVDLVVKQPTPEPVGRSWAYDWERHRFSRSSGSKSPRETHGNETLRGWVEKCLQTARGAHPIHPPRYGIVRRSDIIGGPVTEPPADLTDRITDALTFHPRIANVTDFAFSFDPDDEYVVCGFTVVTDRDEQVPFDQVQLSP